MHELSYVCTMQPDHEAPHCLTSMYICPRITPAPAGPEAADSCFHAGCYTFRQVCHALNMHSDHVTNALPDSHVHLTWEHTCASYAKGS